MHQPLFILVFPCLLALNACASANDASSPGTPAPTDDAKVVDASPSRDDASPSRDDGGAIPNDSSIGIDPGVDASVPGDASLPPLPPAFTQCTTCMTETCAPQIAACNADPYCQQLLACTITSSCLASGASTCIQSCAGDLGLTPKQTVAETKLLEAMATSCASCLTECPKPDAAVVEGGS